MKKKLQKSLKEYGYGTFKETVANTVISKLQPIQEKYKEIIQDSKYLESIYTKGAQNAEEIANNTLNEVKQKIGLILK